MKANMQISDSVGQAQTTKGQKLGRAGTGRLEQPKEGRHDAGFADSRSPSGALADLLNLFSSVGSIALFCLNAWYKHIKSPGM